MTYRLILNQPLQSPANVLRGVLRFVRTSDCNLRRLEELWHPLPDAMGIFDSFNGRVLRFAVPADDTDDPSAVLLDDGWFIPDPEVSIGTLSLILNVINDHYGDLFAFDLTPYGCSYYRADAK